MVSSTREKSIFYGIAALLYRALLVVNLPMGQLRSLQIQDLFRAVYSNEQQLIFYSLQFAQYKQLFLHAASSLRAI